MRFCPKKKLEEVYKRVEDGDVLRNIYSRSFGGSEQLYQDGLENDISGDNANARKSSRTSNSTRTTDSALSPGQESAHDASVSVPKTSIHGSRILKDNERMYKKVPQLRDYKEVHKEPSTSRKDKSVLFETASPSSDEPQKHLVRFLATETEAETDGTHLDGMNGPELDHDVRKLSKVVDTAFRNGNERKVSECSDAYDSLKDLRVPSSRSFGSGVVDDPQDREEAGEFSELGWIKYLNRDISKSGPAQSMVVENKADAHAEAARDGKSEEFAKVSNLEFYMRSFKPVFEKVKNVPDVDLKESSGEESGIPTLLQYRPNSITGHKSEELMAKDRAKTEFDPKYRSLVINKDVVPDSDFTQDYLNTKDNSKIQTNLPEWEDKRSTFPNATVSKSASLTFPQKHSVEDVQNPSHSSERMSVSAVKRNSFNFKPSTSNPAGFKFRSSIASTGSDPKRATLPAQEAPNSASTAETKNYYNPRTYGSESGIPRSASGATSSSSGQQRIPSVKFERGESPPSSAPYQQRANHSGSNERRSIPGVRIQTRYSRDTEGIVDVADVTSGVRDDASAHSSNLDNAFAPTQSTDRVDANSEQSKLLHNLETPVRIPSGASAEVDRTDDPSAPRLSTGRPETRSGLFQAHQDLQNSSRPSGSSGPVSSDSSLDSEDNGSSISDHQERHRASVLPPPLPPPLRNSRSSEEST